MTDRATISRARVARHGILILLAGLVTALALKAQGYSHARIVRLSFVQGTVSISRPGVAEWSQAPVNTPIEQGFKVATAANSFAEIEFENSSTARLGELSELDFTELALAPDGGKINRMNMVTGYATFDVIPEAGDVYTVTADGTVLRPSGRTIFRVDLNSTAQRVEVFRGIVNVSSPYGSGQLTKNDVLHIDPTTRAYVVTHGITMDAWDRWVEKRDQVLLAERTQSSPALSSAYSAAYPNLYGWNELSYYGDWSDIPGYGFGWSPFASAGWMPYSFGQWAWYPGFGWTWIDYDPWGWLPFHYGNWAFISGFGWTWFPGPFGYWSPACVTWYQGDGWVGWSPGTSGVLGNPVIAVGTGTFRTGRPIDPAQVIREQPQSGQRLASPNVAPTVSAYLPGRPISAPNLRIMGRPAAGIRGPGTSPITAGATRARVTSGMHTLVMGRPAAPRTGVPAPTVVLPSVTAFAGTKAASHTPSGIVFDSRTGTFVNSPNAVAPTARGRENITLEPSRAPNGEAPKAGTLLAPRMGTSLSTAPHTEAPAQTTAPKKQGWFSRLFGGRSAPRSAGASGTAAPRGRQMQLGQPAPRGGMAAPRQESRPVFGHAASPRTGGGFGGVHESAPHMGGGGFGGGIHMESGGGGFGGGAVHSAPAASSGRPH